MARVLILRVEVLEVDQSGGLVVVPRLHDTYHGQRYDTLNPQDS